MWLVCVFKGGEIVFCDIEKDGFPNVKNGVVSVLDWVMSVVGCWLGDFAGALPVVVPDHSETFVLWYILLFRGAFSKGPLGFVEY